MSFVRERPLSVFIRSINPSLMQSLQTIHLFWPSWWKMQVYSRILHCTRIGTGRMRRKFWPPPEPDFIVAKTEWEDLWFSFSRIGLVKRPLVTIFQVWRSSADPTTFILINELLPTLSSVKRELKSLQQNVLFGCTTTLLLVGGADSL